VKKAYHVLCHDCAIATKQCAKCLKSETEIEIIKSLPSEAERVRLDNEMKQMIKSLSERKRRTFLRFMNGKKKRKSKNDDDNCDSDDEEPGVADKPLPTRDELLLKLDQLKLADGKNDDHDDFYDDIMSSDEEGWASELSD
jgi:hypothetical protein